MKMKLTGVCEIQLNYRSGNSVTVWCETFKVADSQFTYLVSISPSDSERINAEWSLYNDGDMVFNDNMSHNEYTEERSKATKRIIILGPDDIESVLQLQWETVEEYVNV